MRKISRRRFVKRGAAAVGTALAAPLIVPSSVLGKAGAVAPSERITMAAIGVGGMGRADLRGFLTQPDVRVLAVCDVDKKLLDRSKRTVNKYYDNDDCAGYNDFREVIARDDIDTVMIATPDHWHALISIAAAKAGKDIYCEKPISLTIAEGRAVVETMKRYGTVYQSGTQRRSVEPYAFAVRTARSGMLGKLESLHSYLKPGPECGVQPAEPVPEGFDYDMWLGQAPYEPYTPKRCHGTFRWIYDYSGGQLTDLGTHFNDLGQWANDTELTGPLEYDGWSEFPKEGLWDTPTRHSLTATYADGVKLILHDEPMDTRAASIGVKFVGEEGWVSANDIGEVDASLKSILETRKDRELVGYTQLAGHHRNFLDCVKTRAQTIAPPEIAHRSTTTCHVANICLRLGRNMRWNPETERFIDDPEADRMLARTMRPPWRL